VKRDDRVCFIFLYFLGVFGFYLYAVTGGKKPPVAGGASEVKKKSSRERDRTSGATSNQFRCALL
jgi:hypothetical protein